MKQIRRQTFWGWLVTLVILFWAILPPTAWGQDVRDLSPQQVQILQQFHYQSQTINDLESRQVLSSEQARKEREYYYNQTAPQFDSAAYLQPDFLEQLEKVTVPTPSFLQKIKGVLTFANVIWVISSFLLVISLGWLTVLYVLPLLLALPVVFYEVLVYFACVNLIVGGTFVGNQWDEFIVLPGCLGLVGASAFSHYLHKNSLEGFYRTIKGEPYRVNTLLFCLIWGAIAIFYQSQVIGFLAVIALEAFLGFAIWVFPGAYYLGFAERSLLPRTVISSFLLLAFYVIVKVSSLALPYFQIFQSGVFFVGTFVYFIGVLIWSAKWYKHQNSYSYWVLQAVVILSGIAALYLGAVLGINQLQGIGGTVFCLYLLEKYFEIPWRSEYFAWCLLGLAILLYGFAWFIRQYPQYFLPSLFF